MKRICLIVIFFLFCFSGVVQAATLVGYWPFEESSGLTVYDWSGYDNDGTLTGATRSVGKYGSGLTFDGSGRVTVPNSPTLDTLPGGFTLSAWVKARGSNLMPIFSKQEDTNLDDTLLFYLYSPVERLDVEMNQYFNNGGFAGTSPTGVVLANEWSYVAWTYDGK